MFWRIASFPPCRHHAFLSHCAEDRAALVAPVAARLAAAGTVPWIDVEDYYYGRDSRTALRDGILASRHIVFFVTPAMLTVARGWCVLELAFAELLDLNLTTPGGKLAHAYLPLFLVPQTEPHLPRSVWQVLRDRGRFFDPAAGRDPVEWCAAQVLEFMARERLLAAVANSLLKKDRTFARTLRGVPGLLDRVTKFQPEADEPEPPAAGSV